MFWFCKAQLRLGFFVVSTLGLLLPAQAQDSLSYGEKKTAHYGLKAGVNFAELWGEDAIAESDRKVGYSFGLYAAFPLTKSLKLQPELLWSLQGESSEKKGRYDISYLNIPVMLKWTEGRFYTEIGPQLGLLTLSSSKGVPQEESLSDFETFDVGINLGLGYEVFDDWTLSLRYGQGFINLVPGKDLKNSVIYLGIAYRVF